MPTKANTVPPRRRTEPHLLRALRAMGRGTLRVPRSLAWLPVLAWLVLIYALGAQAGLSGVSHLHLGLLGDLAHAPLYGLLAYWVLPLFPRRERWVVVSSRAAAWIVAFCAGVGWLDEWHQSHVPGRDASLGDVLTDAVGAAGLLWVALYLGRPNAGARGLAHRLALAAAGSIAAAWLAYATPGLWPAPR